MSYCPNCGSQIPDGASFCPNCGCATASPQSQPVQPVNQGENVLRTLAKVFMVLGCVASASFLLIPLLWTIPMTVTYFKRTEQGLPVSTAFKICSLLFVNLIAGVLMLCDDKS